MSTDNYKRLSTAEKQTIATLLADGKLSNRAIARFLGRSESTIRGYIASHSPDHQEPEDKQTLDPSVRMGRQIQRQQGELSALRKQVREVNKRGFGFDDFREALQLFTETEKLKPLNYYPTQIAKAKKRHEIAAVDAKHSEIATLALSDWHLTEVVKLADSNGINKYNSVIGANRLWEIVQKFKQILTIHSAAYPFTKIWLPTLGDMISGSIHEEFLTSNDGTDQVAQLLCIRLFEMLILELKSLGLPIQIDCVAGNHPRTTKKVPTKDLMHTNLEFVVYEMVKHLFRNDDQVEVNVHTSQLAIVNMFEHRYVIEHGIDWKNNREEDFEAAIRNLLDDPIYRKATGIKGASFDNIVIGNLHKPAFMERTVKNGSLIGQNELGQQWRLKPIKAQQLMWGISRSHVRTFQYQLDVTDVKSQKAENPFSEFAIEFMRDHGRYNLL